MSFEAEHLRGEIEQLRVDILTAEMHAEDLKRRWALKVMELGDLLAKDERQG